MNGPTGEYKDFAYLVIRYLAATAAMVLCICTATQCLVLCIYAYILKHTYIYSYTYIFATALCVLGVTRFSKLPSNVCNPIFCSLLILGLPPDQDGYPSSDPTPLWAAFENHVFADTHYFALWIHYTIHRNLICWSTSNVLVTFSLSYKSIIFTCSFKKLTKRKSKTIEKR